MVGVSSSVPGIHYPHRVFCVNCFEYGLGVIEVSVYDLYVVNGHNGLYYSSHDAFVCIRSESRVE